MAGYKGGFRIWDWHFLVLPRLDLHKGKTKDFKMILKKSLRPRSRPRTIITDWNLHLLQTFSP